LKPEPPFARSKSLPESRGRKEAVARAARVGADASCHEVTRARERVEDEERRWTERAIARDQDAFRALVERHRDRAYALALRIVRSPLDAEEVAQDAFVRAWTALPGFRLESRFSTWLHRIVARRALDRVAQLKLRREREGPIAVVIETAATPDASEPETRGLEPLIGELSDAQRAVVTLFYYEDLSVERVAEILQMPVGTVKTHLSRARRALREAWTRAEQADP
jgi:RNA polymerase sigma-70 factor, ECF subfamily